MKTNDLYGIAAHDGIAVYHGHLPLLRSFCTNDGGELAVAMDSALTSAEERVCLAHELGHCETLGFYEPGATLDERRKHERRADRWAILKLIPKEEYLAALRDGCADIYSLAERFSVTEDFMRKVAEFYRED